MFQNVALPFWKLSVLVCPIEISVFTLFSVASERRNCGEAANATGRILTYSRESVWCLTFGYVHDVDLCE